MQKFALAALCLGLTAGSALGASNVFVTAGFSVEPPPALYVTPDPMWTNTPVGQEFVSGVSRFDFVEVFFGSDTAAHYRIVLHEQTITGPVAAVSETVLRDYTGPDMTRFSFSPPAVVSAGTPYVLELVRQEPMTSAEDSPQIYRPGAAYSGGNRVWRGVSQPGVDFYFRAGVFVPLMFSTNQPAMVSDGVTRYFDRAARFENPYVTNFDGATLRCQLNSTAGDWISLASGGIAEIGVAPDTGDIYYNDIPRGAVSFGHVLTNDLGSNSITAQFNAHADAGAVGAVLRSLLFTAPERALVPGVPPRVSISVLRATFIHLAGEATEGRYFVSAPHRINTLPPTYIYVFGAGGGTFLNGGPVFITRLLRSAVTVECNLGTLIDADGDPLTFTWWKRPNGEILSTWPRFTNDYAPGLHRVDATIADGRDTVGAEAFFEVITPIEAVTRLRADLAQRDLGRNERRLETPLRIADYAIKRRQWPLAARQVEVFRQRLGRYIGDEELYARWFDAGGDIKAAVAPRRRQVINPPGVFPRPPIPVPLPR